MPPAWKIDAVNGELLHKLNMVQSDSYKVFAAPAASNRT